MTVLERQTEAAVTWPAIPDAPADVDNAAVWQRIEDWIRHRWPSREVVWLVQGPGFFDYPLAEVDVTKHETWGNGQWRTVAIEESPIGMMLDDDLHRITATVGNETAPDAVLEAATRLAQYNHELACTPPATSYSLNAGGVSESVSYPMKARARALQLSGAADLLRRYR